MLSNEQHFKKSYEMEHAWASLLNVRIYQDMRCLQGKILVYRTELVLQKPGRVAQSLGHLTRKSGVLGSMPSLATYFRFSFRFFKKGSCQLLAKVCARSTG